MHSNSLNVKTLFILCAAGSLAITAMLGAPPWTLAQDLLTLRGPGSGIGATFRNALLDSNVGGSRSVVVATVQSDSPAATAGIRAGDRVAEFDGVGVRDTRHLTQLVAETPPGRTVNLKVVRDGRTRVLRVTPMLERSGG